jgi:hypothetical protein
VLNYIIKYMDKFYSNKMHVPRVSHTEAISESEDMSDITLSRFACGLACTQPDASPGKLGHRITSLLHCVENLRHGTYKEDNLLQARILLFLHSPHHHLPVELLCDHLYCNLFI